MPELKTTCCDCGTTILAVTSARTSGRCMPCHYQANPQIFTVKEPTAEDEQRWQANRGIIEKLIGGCSEQEFLALRCPTCSAPLKLSVHHDLKTFALFCSAQSTHIGIHESVEKSPDWWQSYATDGWY